MRKRVAALVLAAAATLMLIPGAGHAKAKAVCFEKTVGRLHIQVGYCP
jgi:hypothetical protein